MVEKAESEKAAPDYGAWDSPPLQLRKPSPLEASATIAEQSKPLAAAAPVAATTPPLEALASGATNVGEVAAVQQEPLPTSSLNEAGVSAGRAILPAEAAMSTPEVNRPDPPLRTPTREEKFHDARYELRAEPVQVKVTKLALSFFCGDRTRSIPRASVTFY